MFRTRLPLHSHLLTGASLVVMTGIAAAADLAKAPPPPVIAAPWAGSYLGIHGGYGWVQDSFRQPADALVTPGQYLNGTRGQGALYGIHFGHNWQNGRLVTGLEADFSATDLRGSTGVLSETLSAGPVTQSASTELKEKVNFLSSARLRAGWLATDNLLFYGTAGLAWEQLDLIPQQSQTLQSPGNNSFATATLRLPVDKFGWVAGLGVETMLGSPNWIGRIEYLHYDFANTLGNSTTTTTQNGVVASSSGGTHSVDLVRAGISYKFGTAAGGPTSAYAAAPGAAVLAASWAGFYLGGHGGYGWGKLPISYPLALFDPTSTQRLEGINSRGWLAGAHMGQNWQHDRVITSLEADLDAANISGSTNTGSFIVAPNTLTRRLESRVDYLGTLRGRLGWLASDNLLLYSTGGLAWRRETRTTYDTEAAPGGQTAQRRLETPGDSFGFVLGAGAEARLSHTNWTARIEYLHYDFGRVSVDGSFATSTPTINLATTIGAGRQTLDIVRAGASYRFGSAPADAMAADMPVKARPVLPASWAGFYIGAHGGYAWKENDFASIFRDNVVIGGIDSRGWIAGGHTGFNTQSGRIAAGVELDGSATGIRGSSAQAVSNAFSGVYSDDVKYLGTLRGRLGWSATDTFLLYGTGGLAWERATRVEKLVNGTNPANVVTNVFDTARDRFGWAAGAGGEFVVSADRRWIGRLEYLHYDFGKFESASQSVSTIPGQLSVSERAGRQTIDVVRAGISYRLVP